MTRYVTESGYEEFEKERTRVGRKPKPRPPRRSVWILSIDNKDLWIVTVDFSKDSLLFQHRVSDPAWVNVEYAQFGWLRDDHTLCFQPERSGFAHLYTKTADATPVALTRGRFEVTAPVLSTNDC